MRGWKKLKNYDSQIGNLNDYVHVPFTNNINSILALLNTNYYHFHGRTFVYPQLANAVNLQAGAGAWGIGGSITEIIPENALNVAAFDLHWINIQNISATAEYLIVLYSGELGSEEIIGGVKFWSGAIPILNQITKYIQIPQQVVNTRISAKLYSSDVGTPTCQISLEGHYYSD